MAEDALKASEICQDVAPDSRWSEPLGMPRGGMKGRRSVTSRSVVSFLVRALRGESPRLWDAYIPALSYKLGTVAWCQFGVIGGQWTRAPAVHLKEIS